MTLQYGLRLTGGSVLVLVLGACGGGGNNAGTPVADGVATPAAARPPAIASALAYIAQQQSLPGDDIQPEQLQRLLASPDDTAEPNPI